LLKYICKYLVGQISDTCYGEVKRKEEYNS